MKMKKQKKKGAQAAAPAIPAPGDMKALPDLFPERMKTLLGEECEAFLKTYENPAWAGLRVNTRKPVTDEWVKNRERVPWTKAGYYRDEAEPLSRHPYYYAGAFYLQEPSAMSPAEFLPVEPGDKVLDLCAAPGGKSTRLGEKLLGQGMLLANDISASRAQALLRNLERFGIAQVVVTAETPEHLAEAYPCFFDKILVDAPCSGEGMFRKDPALRKSWAEHGPEYYAPIQKEILKAALKMLKGGGYLLYSTCTFSRCEDEDVVLEVLGACPEMERVPLAGGFGTAPAAQSPTELGIVESDGGYRFYPHKLKGEGHFLSLWRKRPGSEVSQPEDTAWSEEKTWPEKKAQSEKTTWPEKTAWPEKTTKTSSLPSRDPEWLAAIREWEERFGVELPAERIYEKKERLYLLPEDFPLASGIRYLRTGLYLGDWKKNRFQPSQALAMSLSVKPGMPVVNFEAEDPACIKYLKGETVTVPGKSPETEAQPDDPETEAKTESHEALPSDGLCLVAVDGLPLGFAVKNGDTLKNKLDPGWRMM